MAPDAVYVDAAGTNFAAGLGPDGLFHGTSAAAPNAAAVAALIRSAFPILTPAQLTLALQSGQNSSGVPDGTFGYGRVDALSALTSIPPPTVTTGPSLEVVGGTSSAAYQLSVGGVGPLRLAVGGSDATLIPGQIVPAGTPGVTIAPAGCGTTTSSCTILYTPVLGRVGSASMVVQVFDNAMRMAQSSIMVTVRKPAVPTLSLTSGNQSFTVGGAASPIGFTVAGTGPLSIRAASSNGAVLPTTGIAVTSGCGSTVLSCSAAICAGTRHYGIDRSHAHRYRSLRPSGERVGVH